ncbi:MAG: metallophosphoesterase, partial [Acidobacteriota bacterium]|nr:metallophosphoesterase [Acidobacteriota bacterium]
ASGGNEAPVAQLVKSWQPDFIITLGGNNYPNGEASTIDANIGQYYHEYINNYQGGYGSGSLSQSFLPALGEQDYRTAGAAPYLNYFTLPGNERYYDFVRGDVHFFVLDSNPETPSGVAADGVQATWLRDGLAAAAETWKIVYFYHSPYSSSVHKSNDYMRWSFKEWGASVVLTGQNNGYERLSIDKLPFIINGLGGNSGDDFGKISPYSRFRYNENFGAMKVESNPNIIQFQFYNRHGLLVDNFSLQALAPPSKLSALPVPGGFLQLSWSDLSSAEQGFRVEKSIDGQSFRTIGTAAANQTNLVVGKVPFEKTYYRVRAFRNDDESLCSNVIITKRNSAAEAR